MARKKGELGRKLGVTPHCYASFLGGCNGINQEHPLSECLRKGRRLNVVIHKMPPGATAWRKTFSAHVSMRQASGPVLCVAHNGGLSPADKEGGRLSDALQEAAARVRSPVIRAYEPVHIKGDLFGRWLCKYYAGLMAMTGQDRQPDFIRYAFGLETSRRLYFLFPVMLGHSPALGDLRNIPLQTFHTVPGGPEAFRVTFVGLDVVVTNFDPRSAAVDMRDIYGGLPDGIQMIDRLRVLRWPMQQFRIAFSWDDDPDEPRLVNLRGMPQPRR